MFELETTKEIIITFAGTSLAMLSAGVIWFFKTSYEKHKAEVLALMRLEEIYWYNINLLRDNLDFIEQWLNALSFGRRYSVIFQIFITNNKEAYKLSNIPLINKVLSLNYKLRRVSLDLENLYKDYSEMVFRLDSITDEQDRAKNVELFYRSIKKALELHKINYKLLRSELLDILATINVAVKIRKYYSLFGYLDFCFRDIFPRVNKKSIRTETVVIEKKINEMLSNKP